MLDLELRCLLHSFTSIFLYIALTLRLSCSIQVKLKQATCECVCTFTKHRLDVYGLIFKRSHAPFSNKMLLC